MKINKKVVNDIVIFTPEKLDEDRSSEEGVTIDIGNNKILVDEIDRELEKGKNKIIINLKNISFVDSSGLQGLFTCAINVKKRSGKLLISNTNNNILRIFKITSLLDIVANFKDESLAIDSLKD